MEQPKKSFFLLALKPGYRIALIAMLLVLGAVFAVGSSLHATHAAPAAAGCPQGDFCIYNGNGIVSYYNYGTYNLQNEIGNHYIVNNQFGGAVVLLCTGSNGRNCSTSVVGGGTYNLTPINSIVLAPANHNSALPTPPSAPPPCSRHIPRCG